MRKRMPRPLPGKISGPLVKVAGKGRTGPSGYHMTRPPDGWQNKPRTCPNCFKKFTPTKWWQRFCPETEDKKTGQVKSCRLEFHRTGQVSLVKFRHYIDTKTKAAHKEILERITILAGEIEKVSAKLERHVEQFEKRTRDLEEFRRRQQAI